MQTLRFAFFNQTGQLRNGWWIGIFFLLMAVLLFPLTFALRHAGKDVELWHQALISLAAATMLQKLRRQPLSELTGRIDRQWLLQLLHGCVIGLALMGAPACLLYLGGWISWDVARFDATALLIGLQTCVLVAVTEELVFRGVLLQRLTAGIGMVSAQLLVAAYFCLTHSNNPGMEGSIKLLASANIFLAALMFGLAYFRHASLALPIGIHLMANFMQGSILGFGVSGQHAASWLVPVFDNSPTWLTGGQFGLEASLPGLMTVIVTLAWLLIDKPRRPAKLGQEPLH